MPFVFIVEAPHPADVFEGRTEGRAFSETLAMAGRAFALRTTLDETQFRRALSMDPDDLGIGAEIKRYVNEAPVLHLSLHGNDDGVGLTDGSFITWEVLRALLEPINDFLPAGLLVCLSTCNGFSAVQMSMQPDCKPLYGIVGSTIELGWAEGLVGFSSFYHNWFSQVGWTPDQCVDAMRYASGHHAFRFRDGGAT